MENIVVVASPMERWINVAAEAERRGERHAATAAFAVAEGYETDNSDGRWGSRMEALRDAYMEALKADREEENRRLGLYRDQIEFQRRRNAAQRSWL